MFGRLPTYSDNTSVLIFLPVSNCFSSNRLPHRTARHGSVRFLGVLLDHAPRAELGRDGANCRLGGLYPLSRDALLVARVECGRDLLLEQAVERVRLGAVVLVGPGTDHPAVALRMGLPPPPA